MINRKLVYSNENVLELDSTKNYLEKELYELIKKDESIFHFMQDSALDGLWFWDLENPENEWMNRKFWITLGYDPEEMPHTSASWQSIINQEDLQLAIINFELHCKDPSHPYDQIVRYEHKLGHTVWIHCRGLVIRDKNGKPFRMLGAHTDVTNLKKAELNLKKQVDKYQHVIDGSNIGIWEWELQTGKAIFNDRWAEILGYSLLEISPTTINTWQKSIHPKDLEKSDELLKKHLSGKAPIYECEIRMKHKTGEWIWVFIRGKIVSRTAKSEPELMIGSLQEITKRKKEHKQSQAFIRQAPTAIAMFDTNMCYLAYSQKWLTDYNIKEENIVGKSHYAIFPEIGDKWKKDHSDCLNGKILKSDEDRFERLNGTVQWLTWEIKPWYTDENKIGGIIMYTADITEKKEIEAKLKISEETFRGNFENAAIGMAIVSLDGKWEKVNHSLCIILGYTDSELLHSNFKDITYSEDLEADEKAIVKLLNNTVNYIHLEKRYIHKKGHLISVILSVSLVKDENGKPLHFLAQIINITPRVKAKEKMQEALAKIEGIFESSSQVSIIGTDLNGTITAFNKGAENLLGYTKDEVLFKETPVIIHSPEEIEDRGKNLSKLFNKKVEGFEVFTILAKRGEYDTKEWTYIRKDGSKFPVQLTITPVKEYNKIVGYLGVATDISNIKEAEKEIRLLLQVAKGQNDRLINFAHIVSHNLKSHSGNFGMLLELFLQENEDFKDNEMIKMFKDASKNLSDTILHLNEVVLMNTSLDDNLVPINLNNSIKNALTSLTALIKDSNIIINNSVNPDIQILGIPAYMDSILLNLISNAIKYRSPECDSFVNLKTSIENNFVILSIEDNGLGIDLKKHEQKLFGMYKTFHHNKDARGIGLFITKNQVEAIGGKIEVESKVGCGSTFKIYMKYEKN